MDRHTFTRTCAGLVIIAVGVMALLGSFQVLDFGNLFADWWPLLLVGAGLMMLINSPREFAWPIIFICIGLLFQLRNLDLLTFNIWHLIWPAIIISFGLSILFSKSYQRINKTSEDTQKIQAILGGHTVKNQSQNFKGGSASAILGGVKLDLRETSLEKEAVLRVFSFMGGVEITVPKDWTVQVRVTPILGGVENNSTNEHTGKNAPTLTIIGEAILGGIEIKR